MKPVIAAVLFVCVLLSACSAGQTLPSATVPDDIQSGRSSAAAEQTSSPSPLPSPSPTQSPSTSPLPTASPSPAPKPTEYYTDAAPFSGFTMEPNESTVVIADAGGTILFGYSDGRWLTHSQAAAYCGEYMKFYRISLNGKKASVSSQGAKQDEEYSSSSSASNGFELTYDDSNDINLKYDREVKGYFCRINPERIPKIKFLTDRSSFLPAVQSLVDEQFGESKVSADITYAVQTDIDSDGSKETIINASNLEGYDRYEFEESEEGLWYSIVCAIEPEGTFAFIESSYNTGWKEESHYMDIWGIADIDGNGICEILAYAEGWEWGNINICIIDEQRLVSVADNGWAA